MSQLSERTLLDFLKVYGGKIISTNDMSPEQISEARDGGRFYVDADGFGYVWEFCRFPETPEEVELFEKWYPHPIDRSKIPTFEDFQRRMIESKQTKYN